MGGVEGLAFFFFQTYPEPSFPVLGFDLVLVPDPIAVPSPQGRRVVDAHGIDPFDFEAGALERIHEPAQRRRRVGAGEDVFVHEQAPDQILVLPAFAQTRDLQEEDPVVVQHVVYLAEEGGEVPHPDVFGHLQAGDLLIPACRHGDVAVVHTQDLALALLDTGFSHGVVAPRGLVPSQCHTGSARTVLRAGVFREGAPSAANVKQGLARLDADLLTHHRKLVILQLLQRLFFIDVRDDAGGIYHPGPEEPTVEVVTSIVMVSNLLLVCSIQPTVSLTSA